MRQTVAIAAAVAALGLIALAGPADAAPCGGPGASAAPHPNVPAPFIATGMPTPYYPSPYRTGC